MLTFRVSNYRREEVGDGRRKVLRFARLFLSVLHSKIKTLPYFISSLSFSFFCPSFFFNIHALFSIHTYVLYVNSVIFFPFDL